MIIKVNKRNIESFSILLAMILIAVTTVGTIVAIADMLFKWDLFPKGIEKIAILIFSSFGLIILAAFVLNIMVNLSIISSSLEKIANENKNEFK